MDYRPLKKKSLDLQLARHEEQACFNTLIKTPTLMREIYKGALVWAGRSRIWPYPECEPFFENADESKYLFYCYFMTLIIETF